MNRGCLGGLGRLVGMAVLRLGSLLAAAILSAAGFLILNIIGPLLVGGAREFVQALMGMPREGGQAEGRLFAANPAAYAVVSGLAWALCYGLLAVLTALAGRSALSICSLFGLSDPGHTGVLLTMALLAALGAIVGLLVHEYQRGVRVE